MGNTTKLKGRMLQIKGLDADWSVPGDFGTDYAKSGLMVRSITFHPSAANDVMIIKQGKAADVTTAGAVTTTATDPELFHVKCAGTTDQRVKYFGDRGQRMWPYIDITDCTLDTAASARVEIELA